MKLKIYDAKGSATDKSVNLSKDVFGIEPNAFGAIGAVVNFFVASIVSRKYAGIPSELNSPGATLLFFADV